MSLQLFSRISTRERITRNLQMHLNPWDKRSQTLLNTVSEKFTQTFVRTILQLCSVSKTEMIDVDSKERQKAADAEKLMNSICNVKFVLILSGITDIYEKYGELINVFQKVNSLPHKRFDTFIHVCNKMKMMSERMNHDECEAKSCLWPTYHDDVKKLDDTYKYMGIPIVDDHSEKGPNVTRS